MSKKRQYFYQLKICNINFSQVSLLSESFIVDGFYGGVKYPLRGRQEHKNHRKL